MAMQRKAERNDAIVAMRRRKRTFTEIARVFGLKGRQQAFAIWQREKARALARGETWEDV